MSDLCFDTCFLIDLEREQRRGAGPAHSFLAANTNDRSWISWIVAGEFAAGFGEIDHAVCAAMLGRFNMLPMNAATVGSYARVSVELRREKRIIGANDLWIAAGALAAEFPLVTNNTEHFGRVRGLKLLAY